MGAVKKTRCGMVPARVSLALLTSIGVVVLYVLRINMSVAIVAMVKPVRSRDAFNASRGAVSKAYCSSLTAASNVNATAYEDYGEFGNLGFNATEQDDWDESEDSDKLALTSTERGMVLGAFFYGYFATNIPGGRLAEEYGTKRVFGGSILISALLTLLIPVAARESYIFLILLRVIIGLVNGVVYPAMNVMVARWIPPLERARFMSVSYMSNSLGTILTLPVCALIADTMGWPAVFYITGGASLFWVAAWLLLMHDTPEEHPRISPEEKKYILEAIKEEQSQAKPTQTPWCTILCSLPLWAITIAHTGCMFGFNLLLTQLPSYMDSILGFSITSTGLLSSLPFLSQFLAGIVSGVVGDWLVSSGHIGVHNSRRLFCTISVLLPGLLIVLVGYMGCNTTMAVVVLCLSSAFVGTMCSGQLANTHDLSPNYSGTSMGISNTFAYAVSMCVPVIAGAMTPDQTLEEWKGVFWLTGGIQTFCWLFFLVFSSVEVQPWNNGKPSCDEEKMTNGGVVEVNKGEGNVEEKLLKPVRVDKPEIV
ncbi:sialin-like [Portunus trituberculatus]|uniref:sialin-like n=1 Tax=Portunus trituberculatus TaxID=210409 RepID=UPI001E1CE894|nr:sialin-like [Portunus trituberculatus]